MKQLELRNLTTTLLFDYLTINTKYAYNYIWSKIRRVWEVQVCGLKDHDYIAINVLKKVLSDDVYKIIIFIAYDKNSNMSIKTYHTSIDSLLEQLNNTISRWTYFVPEKQPTQLNLFEKV